MQKKSIKIGMFFTGLYFFSNVHTSITRGDKPDDSGSLNFSNRALQVMPFYPLDDQEEIETGRNQQETLLLVTELCQRPIGWLTQQQLDMLRTTYNNNPECDYFKQLNLTVQDILREHPSVLTFSELLVFEQVTRSTIFITAQEDVVILKNQ